MRLSAQTLEKERNLKARSKTVDSRSEYTNGIKQFFKDKGNSFTSFNDKLSEDALGNDDSQRWQRPFSDSETK